MVTRIGLILAFVALLVGGSYSQPDQSFPSWYLCAK